ncbi:MAG: T9SS type A sorting domain-containing protein [Saprospiraceae bacterium]
MKKTLLFFCSFLFLTSASVSAQDCQRDSNLFVTMDLLSPAPFTPDSPFYNLAIAYINQPYEQSVSVLVPTEFSGFPIDSVGLATTGAVPLLPSGISYSCDPPNCIFMPGTLGCILLSGTPDGTNTYPDTVDLGITATVYTPLIDLPVSFPGQVAPGSHYYLPVLEFVIGTNNQHPQLSGLKISPNPLRSEALVEVQAKQSGGYQFEVYNLLGQTVYAENMWLQKGANSFTFDATFLDSGLYFYSIGNGNGVLSGRMQIQK